MKKLLFLALLIAGSSFFNTAYAGLDTELFGTIDSSTNIFRFSNATCDVLENTGYWESSPTYLTLYSPVRPQDVTTTPPSDWTGSYTFASSLSSLTNCADFYLDLDTVWVTPSNGTAYIFIVGLSDTNPYPIESAIGYVPIQHNSGVFTVSGGTETGTRIIENIPAPNTTHATSSPILLGASGNVDESDFESGMTLSVSVIKNVNQTAQAVAESVNPCLIGITGFCLLEATDLLDFDYEEEIATYGAFSISRYRNFTEEGRYTITSKINKPLVNFLGVSFGEITLDTQQSSFVVGTTTSYDNFVDETTTFFQDSLQNFNSGTTCNVVSGDFNFGTCLLALFIPNSSMFQAYAQIPQIVAGKFPFSYVSGIAYTWGQLEETATSTPSLVFNLHNLGIGSTTPMGNFLPNQTVFASSTITTYLGSEIMNALKALASVAIILALFLNIFFTVRNMFDKT